MNQILEFMSHQISFPTLSKKAQLPPIFMKVYTINRPNGGDTAVPTRASYHT